MCCAWDDVALRGCPRKIDKGTLRPLNSKSLPWLVQQKAVTAWFELLPPEVGFWRQPSVKTDVSSRQTPQIP